DRRVDPAAVQEAVNAEAAVPVFPDDLAGAVDAVGSSEAGPRHVDRRVDPAAVQVGVLAAVAPDDLAGAVDAVGRGAAGPRDVHRPAYKVRLGPARPGQV